MRFLLLAAQTTASVAETIASTVENAVEETTETVPEIVQALNDTVEETITETVTNVSGVGKMLADMWQAFVTKIPTILFAIAVLVIGMVLSSIILKLMGKALERSKRLDITVAKFLKSVVKILLYVLIVVIVLSLLGIPTTSIITVIGTAGVAIGLALKDSLENIAGGFLILFTKPFKVGSYISTNGVEGTVEVINILFTKLVTLDNKAVYIPNGTAVTGVCVNYNEFDIRRVSHIISISYDEDFDKAKAAITRALNKESEIIHDGRHDPFIEICAHGSSSIDIEVRVWCATPEYWKVYYAVLYLIRKQFIEENIEIPYNQLDVHIKEK